MSTATDQPAPPRGIDAQRAAVRDLLARSGADGLTTRQARDALGLSETRAGDILKYLADSGDATRERPGPGKPYTYQAAGALAAGLELAEPPTPPAEPEPSPAKEAAGEFKEKLARAEAKARARAEADNGHEPATPPQEAAPPATKPLQPLEPGAVACPACGARADLGQPHAAGCAALTSPAAPPPAPEPPAGPTADDLAAAEADELRREWELPRCTHVLGANGRCCLRAGHIDAGVPHEAEPSPEAIEAAQALQTSRQAKADRLTELRREQAAAHLAQLAWRRSSLEVQLDATRAETEVALYLGHLQGLTYEQLADDAQLSRARVGEVLADTRRALEDATPAELEALRELRPDQQAALRLAGAQ